MYARIALFSPPFKTYTYALPEYFSGDFWRPGLRALAPVGAGMRSGCIMAITDQNDLPPGKECRQVAWPLESAPVISADLLALIIELGKRQGVEAGGICAQILPTGLRSPHFKLTLQTGECLDEHKLGQMTGKSMRQFALAVENGSARFQEKGLDMAELEICQLASQPPWPIRPAAKKQWEILNFIHQQGSISKKSLMKTFGDSSHAILRKLIEKGIIKTEFANTQINTVFPAAQTSCIALTNEQESALEDLMQAAASADYEQRLLYGITGSGKTAVYMRLAQKYLNNGQSVLLLAPEVALACKLFADAERELAGTCTTVLYHGYQPAAIREKIFRDTGAQKLPKLIIGTRSALFLPVHNLGCIILDEEHDSSYKQDERLAYHAKEVARYRMEQKKGLLVLGSATPDVRSYYAALTGKLPVLQLARRASGQPLPEMELARLAASAGIGGTVNEANLLAPESEIALRECLDRGEQAVILLNRRGYAPQIFCLKCAKTIRCPHCDIGMSYHKANKRLLCHYCGFALAWPAPCPICGDTSYIPIGEGTEKYAERLEAIAGRPVLRLDRDTARGNGQIESILGAFSRGESPFLVGTQMLSKGHHFPGVTMVLVADGDIGLNMPDYRATERTFQLLTQAAGRAGRGSKPGRAIIQTRNEDHYCWQHVLKHDYEGFYRIEIGLRKKFCYPPFINLGMLRFSWPVEEKEGDAVIGPLSAFVRDKAKELGIILLGPAPAPLPLLNGRKRYQCLMKSHSWNSMRLLWSFAHAHKLGKHLRIMLDLDPVNMM